MNHAVHANGAERCSRHASRNAPISYATSAAADARWVSLTIMPHVSQRPPAPSRRDLSELATGFAFPYYGFMRTNRQTLAVALVVFAALTRPTRAQDRWQTIDVPGTPRGMLQYDTATVMRTRSGKVVSVWERLNHPGEGIGIWKLPTGKRYTYTYELTHWTFDCAARTKSRGAVGFFDAAGHLVEAQPDISLDGLDPVFSPVEAGSWTAATMQAVCGPRPPSGNPSRRPGS